MLFIASTLLAAVFATAALAKLSDSGVTARTLRSYGVSERLVRPGTWALPLAELAVAVAVVSTPRAGALAALAILAVFTLAGAVARARGGSPDCGCFGESTAPAGTRRALARNALLAGVAAAVLVAAGAPAEGMPAGTAPAAAMAAAGALLVVRRGRTRFANAAQLTRVAGGTPDGTPATPSRRALLAAGGAGALALFAGWLRPRAGEARRTICPEGYCCGGCCCQRCSYGCCDCGGIAGGGTVAVESGVAHFSLFGTRFDNFPGRPARESLGSLRWYDPGAGAGGLTLRSVRIDSYGRVDGTAQRRLSGLVSLNGRGRIPFVLTATDAGRPGSAADRLDLRVGEAVRAGTGGPDAVSYRAGGPVTAGDLQLISIPTAEKALRQRRKRQ